MTKHNQIDKQTKEALCEPLTRLKVTVTVEHVTPEEAQTLLGRNWAGQRKPRSMRVAQYAADMRSGLWQDAVAVVDVDVDGNVINGQHVLSAIVLTGLSQWLTIRRGMPTSAFKAIDQHGARALKDMLNSLGAERSTDLSSYLGRMTTFAQLGRFMDGGATVSPASKLLLWSEILKWQTKAGHIVDPVRLMPEADMMNKHLRLPVGFALSILYVMAISDPESDGGVALVSAFTSKVCKGVNLEEGSPVYAYREYLLDRKGKRQGQKDALSAVAAKSFRTWNAWRTGASLTRLIGIHNRGDRFPLPDDPYGNIEAWRSKMRPLVDVPSEGVEAVLKMVEGDKK